MKVYNLFTKLYPKLNLDIISNFFWRCIQIFSKQGISFLILLLCVSYLNIYEFGVYNYILASTFLLILFCDLGISTATSKFVTEYSVYDKEKLNSVLFNAGLIIIVCSFLILLFFAVFGSYIFGANYKYMIFLLPMLILAPLTSLYDGIYRGLRKFKLLTIISAGVGIISILIVYYMVSLYGLIGALIAQDVFYFLLLATLFLGYKEYNFKINKEVISDIGFYSLNYGVAVLGSYLLIRFIVILLGHFNFMEELAIYELIGKFFMIFLLPFTILGQVIAPDFTLLSAEKKFKEIYLKSKQYTIYLFIFGNIIGFALYFGMPFIFEIFFSKYYFHPAFSLIFITSLFTFVFNVWAATFDAGILVPTGYASMMAKFYLTLSFFGIVISYLAGIYFGYTGILVSYTLLSFIMVTGLRLKFLYGISTNLN